MPPGDAAQWRHDPFSGAIEGGELYGRGAVDMKGGIACMMAAALQFIAEQPDFEGSIGFLITGDEEGPAINGTVKLLEWAKARGERFRPLHSRRADEPECLGDMIKIGRRGSLTGRIVVEGKQGHVAYPHLADNPIPGMMRLLEALLRDPLDDGTEHFDASNLEVTTFDVGNPAANVIAAPGTRDVQHPVQRHLDTREPRTGDRPASAGSRRQRSPLHVTSSPPMQWHFLPRPTRSSISSRTPSRPRPAGSRNLSTTGGTSDARFIVKDCPVVEFGLVGQTMHQVDERVAVDDLDRLTAIYRRILGAYFSVSLQSVIGLITVFSAGTNSVDASLG